MNDGGWIKLWRKSLDSAIFKDEGLWHMFSYGLMAANYKPYKALFGGHEEEFPAGSFITGRFILAELMDLSPSTVRNRMKKLEELKMWTLRTDNKKTLITICNWATYQQDEEPERTGERTTNGQQKDNKRTLLKEVKKERREENSLMAAEVVASWNSMAKENGLPVVKMMTGGRKKAMDQRLKEKPWVESYKAALDLIPKSKGLLGDNDRGWKANIGWFLRPDTVPKLLEGFYENWRKPQTQEQEMEDAIKLAEEQWALRRAAQTTPQEVHNG